MNWRLIWKLDKYAHLAGAFMLTTISVAITSDILCSIIAVAIGSILLEAYQWQFKPYYMGKEMDTVLDIIADGIGIALSVVVIRGWV